MATSQLLLPGTSGSHWPLNPKRGRASAPRGETQCLTGTSFPRIPPTLRCPPFSKDGFYFCLTLKKNRGSKKRRQSHPSATRFGTALTSPALGARTAERSGRAASAAASSLHQRLQSGRRVRAPGSPRGKGAGCRGASASSAPFRPASCRRSAPKLDPRGEAANEHPS